jgi:hypothetical protein
LDVVYNFDPADAKTRLEAWCSTGCPADAQSWSRGDYEEHVRDEHSTYTWVLEAVAQKAGFVIEQAEYSDDGSSPSTSFGGAETGRRRVGSLIGSGVRRVAARC